MAKNQLLVKALCSTFILLLCLRVDAQIPASCDSTNALNREILNVVKPYIGKKVDRGECWDLANLALNKVNASWDGLLNYGTKVDWKKECIQPGDILQFEKVELKGKIDGNMEYTETFYHHTAIIYAVHDDGTVELIHQNTGQYGKKVGVTTMNFNDLKKGTIQAYRPTK
jgi:hypothetical protein